MIPCTHSLWVPRPLHGRAASAYGRARHGWWHRSGQAVATQARASKLETCAQIAAARAHESKHPQPLFIDPFAESLALSSGCNLALTTETERAKDIIATKYTDDCLLSALAATSVNRINTGDYRQVVLVGDGLDTRPFRLPLPPGIVVYVVAPLDEHEVAQKVLTKAAGAAPPPGALVRRISADLQAGEDFTAKLEAAGFRGDRPSVWVLQGLGSMDEGKLSSVLVHIANSASYHSLVIGELPSMRKHMADNLLADTGLLGATYGFGEEETHYGRWQSHWDSEARESQLSAVSLQTKEDRWLFAAQQQHLSLQQIHIYETHRQEAEGLDEDFIGNFS